MNVPNPRRGRRDDRLKNGPLLVVRLDWQRLGADIRRRRLERKMTLRYIADLHGLSRSSISRLEIHGVSCNVETLLTLTIMLDLDLHSYAFAAPENGGGGPLTLAAIMGSNMPVMGTA